MNENYQDQNQDENVISVSFQKSEDIAHHIAHPASKNFPLEEEYDDPLQELLDEADIEDEEIETYFVNDFTESERLKANYSQSNREISEINLSQIGQIKNATARLKYFLDELGLERS